MPEIFHLASLVVLGYTALGLCLWSDVRRDRIADRCIDGMAYVRMPPSPNSALTSCVATAYAVFRSRGVPSDAEWLGALGIMVRATTGPYKGNFAVPSETTRSIFRQDLGLSYRAEPLSLPATCILRVSSKDSCHVAARINGVVYDCLPQSDWDGYRIEGVFV